jgi:dTDP-4-amino-4,6-dideoxygalactose transaminase
MTASKNDLPAIAGGKPVREEFLPFFRPSIDEQDVESVAGALRSGWRTLGPQTASFEQALKEYLGVGNVVAVGSCSAAMLLAMKGLGIGPGDEVVTSALTFVSTVHAIIHAGARPVLADIELDTFGPDPAEMEKRTTARTKAYLPVHLGGQACRITDVLDLARSRGLSVVEDAAHGFGASSNGRKVGTFGEATAFSFYATKNLTCGEGGCVSTNDHDLADRIRKLSCHGMSVDSWARYTERGSWYYQVGETGYKFNLSDILSSLGLSQLKKIDRLLERRRQVAERFVERLGNSPYLEIPRIAPGNSHTWHLFVLLLNLERLTIDRDQFIQALAAERIGCSVHFIPVYKHSFFEPYFEPGIEYPRCERYFSRCVSLPIFPDMGEDDVDDVLNAVERVAAYYAKP